MIRIPAELASSKPLLLPVEVRTPETLRGLRAFNAEIARVGQLRDEVVFGIGDSAIFEETGACNISLPEGLSPGLYKLVSFRIKNVPDQDGVEVTGQDFTELLDRSAAFYGCLHFLISESGRSGADVTELANAAYKQRDSVVEEPQVTPRALLLTAPRKFVGFLLCHGTALHGRQDLRGISIIPYGNGLDYSPLQKAASEFTRMMWDSEIERDPQIAADFERQTGTCAILFHQVLALDATDALDYITRQGDDVVTVLGLERGFKPIPFGAFVYDGRSYTGNFFYGRYTGNLLAPFSPGAVGASVEHYLQKIRKFPRARLLLESYVEAAAERDTAFRYLRFWALLEMIAKDAVTSDSDNILDAHGNAIVNDRGQVITTRGAAAKVYKYLFDRGVGQSHQSYEGKYFFVEAQRPPPAGAQVDELLTMWAIVGALYEIRNSVAHTGTFSLDMSAPPNSRLALASRFYQQPHDLLFQFLKSNTWIATLSEINTAT